MFEKFGDYMFYLLTAPLKKAKKTGNQFYIFFQVVGKVFDDIQSDILKVRDESMVISASPAMLPVHGQDRSMKRLKGEDIETYRMRLLMKAEISEKAGSKEGILLALASMGYEFSRIEPMWKEEPERWAEFIIYLRGEKPSSINDIGLIDKEVMKVKQASSMPSYYGEEAGNGIGIYSQVNTFMVSYPLCNTIICGTYPDESREKQ